MKRGSLAVLVFALGAAPLAFGSVEDWASAWLRLLVLLALGLYAWSDSGRGMFPRPARLLALPWAAILVWGLIQSAPLPDFLLERVSPTTHGLYESTVPPGGGSELPSWLLERAGEYGVTLAEGSEIPAGSADEGTWGAGKSISIAPAATRRSVLAWSTPLLAFLVAAGLARHRRQRTWILGAVVAWSGLLGATAILQQGLWNDKILWIRDRPPGTMPLGPYVNPANLANYVAMGSLVMIGLVLAVLAVPRGRLTWDGIREALTDRAWAVPRLLTLGGLGALALSGLALSRSTGGLLAFGVGLLALALAARFRAFVAVLGVVIVVGGVAAGLVGFAGPGLDEMEQSSFAMAANPSATYRLDTWGNTLRIVADHPWTGTGLGTFRWAFPAYQRSGEWLTWEEAHNDYLQFLSEGGLISALLGLWGGWIFLRHVLLGALSRRGEQTRWATVAVGAALLAAMLHAVVDFNLQIPANAYLTAVLLGVLAAAAEDSDDDDDGDEATEDRP